MHRVYNSAFMNMLRDEENAKYRSYLKKTIEFDPDILKRYVNFMSNPDERTAIDQFGTGDKFFGVTTMLATLPGLPMFGHGQIEGFTERYGMEFKRARMEESPNEELIARHQRDIAPLLKERKLFAESTHFVLYDFWKHDGTVDENVFAYSNRLGDQRALILYNNSYGTTHGTIHHSAAAMEKASGTLRQTRLANGLALFGYDTIVAYRDATNGLEYLRRGVDFHHHGLSVTLRGYQHIVLLDWRELHPSSDHPWDRLCDAMRGEGVHSVDAALSRLRLRPLHDALHAVINAENIRTLISVSSQPATASKTSPPEPRNDGKTWPQQRNLPPQKNGENPPEPALPPIDPRLHTLLDQCSAFFDRALASLPTENRDLGEKLRSSSTQTYRAQCTTAFSVPARLQQVEKKLAADWPALARLMPHSEQQWAMLLAWIALGSLPWQGSSTAAFDTLQLRAALAEIFSTFGLEEQDAWRAAAQIRVLLLQSDAVDPHAFWNDGDVRWLAGVNESAGVTYVNKELFEGLADWLQLPSLLEIAEPGSDALNAVLEIEAAVEQAQDAARRAGYKLDTYLELLNTEEEQAPSQL
jgi:hypothetical protein